MLPPQLKRFNLLVQRLQGKNKTQVNLQPLLCEDNKNVDAKHNILTVPHFQRSVVIILF
jgi:hypothetical protein